MGLVSTIVNILAVIGLIIIISYIVYYLYSIVKNRTMARIAANMNPPGDYMQATGVKCPDYWVNTGIDRNGNYICKNSFNISTNNKIHPKCNAEIMKFSPIQSGYTWEYGNPNGLTSYSRDQKYDFVSTSKPRGTAGAMTRCDWVNKCGNRRNVQGIWQGVQDICNNPQFFS